MKTKFLLAYILIFCLLFTGCMKENQENINDTNNITNISPTESSESTPTPTSTLTPEPTVTPSPTPSTEPSEKVIYEFSTTIKSKSSNRLNNIQLTCNTLNGTIVNPQEEFSFCQTIGKSTAEKGYKKADVIINKHVEKALGGGNCQVSTTLYNAVLGISDLKVTERHPHGKAVNYVPEGKDAAIAYGSKDFKFINNQSTSIKIYASTDNNTVTIKIVELS